MNRLSVFPLSFFSLSLLACGSATSDSSTLSSTRSSFTLQMTVAEDKAILLDGLEAEAEVLYQASKKGRDCGDSSVVQLPYAPWWPQHVFQPKLERVSAQLSVKDNQLNLVFADRRSEPCGFEVLNISFPTLNILNQAPRIRFSQDAAQGPYKGTCQVNEAGQMFACSEIQVNRNFRNIAIYLD